ncbi:MFS transporter [Acetobacter sp. TBRC 12305]|uniref:MFS transporter n=1 Tax=Acetobacter garciniae TaxID=2817435 RepID=A0A939HLS3_9PROT|nr:MFS transporter [Acetobacter garciniae]MBO1323883.1 MFS transporter [Acetobacter garciniae]MBX0343572.1 MFS transporter [Acetobacter garciniae]
MNTAQRIRGILAGSAGNLLEYFDWYVYSSFTIYFAHAFFPRGNATAELLNAAAVFAVGFFMRPVGGWLLGVAADKYGRRTALTFSVLAMCLGSLAIAVCPTYTQIGLLSPIVLVVARLFQGLSLGGEYGASATYLAEVSSPRHRGFWSGFLYVTLVMGQLLALLLLLFMQYVVLTPQQIADWGWRVPFLVGSGGAILVFWLRRQMVESNSFEKAQERQDKGGIKVLAQYWRSVLRVCGLTMGGTVAFYTYTIYMQKYLANSLGFSKESATLISAVSLLVFAAMQPAFGAVSDKIGRRPLLLFFGFGATFGTVPLLGALGNAQSAWAALGLIIAALFVASGYTSINAVVKAELFPTRIRALGVAFPYALTVSLFGGTAEYIALWCKQAGHENWFAWYVSATAAVTLFTVLTLKPTDRISEEQG